VRLTALCHITVPFPRNATTLFPHVKMISLVPSPFRSYSVGEVLITLLLASDHGNPGSRAPFHLNASRYHCPLELRYGTTMSSPGVPSTFPTVSVPNCQSPSPAWKDDNSAPRKSRERNTDSKTTPDLLTQFQK